MRRKRMLKPTKSKSKVAKQIDKGVGKVVQLGLGVTAASIAVGSVSKMTAKFK